MHQNGVIEDEENSNDYIALHVYNSKQEGSKVQYEGEKHIKRSTYSPEQTMKLQLELPSSEYMNTGKVLNLVLDQLDRVNDLFFNIDI